MKKELHPGVIALIIAVALALIGWFGYRQMKPGDYVPSPRMGAGNAAASSDAASNGNASAAANQPNAPGEQAYQQTMRGGGPVPGAPDGK